MRMRTTRLLLLVMAVSILWHSCGKPASAQDRLIVADASSSGTYKAMLGEIIDFCSDDKLQIAEAPNQHGGATDNLQALVDNKVSAAFMHSDVIFASAQADSSYRQYKTLVALYPEEIHVFGFEKL